MAIETDYRIRGLEFLDRLKKLGGNNHTPPNHTHYPGLYKWDLDFDDIARARFESPESARSGLEELLYYQNPETGFIPNLVLGFGRGKDPERFTFLNPDKESSYTQPPLEAEAAFETYLSYQRANRENEGREFLRSNYEKLELAYDYFERFRENGGGSKLIGIIHPHESGRDSDPTFDFAKKRLPTRNSQTPFFVGLANTALDYFSAMAINVKLMKVRWNPKIAREKGIFWVNDVMFNCIYAKNLRAMADISLTIEENEKAASYQEKANALEEEIINGMWDEETRMFYARGIDGKPIKKISVSNLFPIILATIDPSQVRRVVDLIQDPRWFGTNYPIPSVPSWSNSYDPHYKEKRLWRGPTWINMNWYIVEGLMLQAKRFNNIDPDLAQKCRTSALNIVKKTAEMVDRVGYWECYDPENGEGLRTHPFAWSVLSDVLKLDYPEYAKEIAA